MDVRTQALIVLIYVLGRDEKGTAALEYLLLVALIALVMMFGAQTFGTALQNWFNGFGNIFG